MEQFKRAQVIKLLTEDNTMIGKDILTGNLEYLKDNPKCLIGYHLYIISDDEIKEDDWFHLDMSDNDHPDEIHQMGKNNRSKTGGINFNNNHAWSKCCKKIIATTDTSLLNTINTPHISGEISKRMLDSFKLPQPSQQFIEKYIKCYNKGKIITDVLVEYKEDKPYKDNEFVVFYDDVKINLKDNTITIKKLKDNWNREEVIELLHSLPFDIELFYGENALNKWIEENL